MSGALPNGALPDGALPEGSLPEHTPVTTRPGEYFNVRTPGVTTPLCGILFECCKPAAAVRIWGFVWTFEFARRWQPNMGYASGVAVRPNTRAQTGFEYVSSGGVSKGISTRQPIEKAEPQWEKSASSVSDGSIVWTPQPISTASLEERIASEVWSPPSGITVESLAHIDEAGRQISAARVSGGTKGQVYDILLRVTTTAGQVREATLRVTID
jgi:hypothetical protein